MSENRKPAGGGGRLTLYIERNEDNTSDLLHNRVLTHFIIQNF